MDKFDIHELFQWRDVPIYWDPVPDWLRDKFSDEIQRELVLVNLDLQRAVLERQLEAQTAKVEIVRKGLGG